MNRKAEKKQRKERKSQSNRNSKKKKNCRTPKQKTKPQLPSTFLTHFFPPSPFTSYSIWLSNAACLNQPTVAKRLFFFVSLSLFFNNTPYSAFLTPILSWGRLPFGPRPTYFVFSVIEWVQKAIPHSWRRLGMSLCHGVCRGAPVQGGSKQQIYTKFDRKQAI